MAVEIKKSVLAKQVEEGWKKQALAEHYNIPLSQMTDVLKAAGLKIRKFHAPKYVFVDDVQEGETTEGHLESSEEVMGEDINVLNESTQEDVNAVEESASVEQVEETETPKASW